MKALVTNHALPTRVVNLFTNKSIGKGLKEVDISKPALAKNEILVKITATALNPIDAKFIDMLAPPGNVAGCDFAGVVSEVGPNAPSTLKVGDRVAGFAQGGIEKAGAFAEYINVEGDLVWKVPEGVSDEEAATYGIPAVTAMQALNVYLDIPWVDTPSTEAKAADATLFIYAGSSAVGLFATQIAKQAGYTVVSTASPHSYDLVKKYGADAVFDYHNANAVQEITKAYPNITKALDCFSEGASTKFCAQVLKSKGGKVVTLLPDSKADVPGVEVKSIMSFQLLGRAFAWLPPIGPKYPVSPTEREALVRFYGSLHEQVAHIKAPPITLLNDGFQGIYEGLDKLRAKKVSGSKLVVKL